MGLGKLKASNGVIRKQLDALQPLKQGGNFHINRGQEKAIIINQRYTGSSHN